MKKNPSSLSRTFLALAAGLLFSTTTCLAHNVEAFIAELGTVTKTAAGTGIYTAGATWVGGTVPGGNDVVLIPAGSTVTVNDTAPIAKTLIVRGTLKFSLTASSRLQVEKLVVADNASLIVGDYGANQAIPANLTAAIVIRDTATVTQDSMRLARGIITSHQAIVRMNSAAARPPFVAFNNSIGPGSTGNLTTTGNIPATWQIGDEIVIPTTVYTREWIAGMPAHGTSRLRNERRTIADINYSTAAGLTLSSPLTYQHLRVDTSLNAVRVHAANLTRNITISSANTTGNVARNGHTMFMGTDVKITGVRFTNLGRTDKLKILSDPGLPTSIYNTPGIGGAPAGNNVSNPRGRYAVHFHEAGPDEATAALVAKCVVDGTPGWGFVNHSSNVNFIDNVAFDFEGAGFVAEDGEETGSFTGNIAIGGLSNGEFSIQRTVFGNTPRMDQGDMGFTGDGFWFQSPDGTVTNNVAAGCKGSGFFFWTAGRFEPKADGSSAGGHYTGRPLTRPLPAGAKPRKWDYNLDGTPDAYFSEDLPLKGFSNNIAYACNTGLRLRFVSHPSIAILDIRGFDLSGEIIAADGAPATSKTQATRVEFPISNCTFWNNLNGIHGTYFTRCNLSNLMIIAAAPRAADNATPIDYSLEAGVGAIGIDLHFNTGNNTLTNVTVKNYTTGLWRDSGTIDGGGNISDNGVTFVNCTENTYTVDLTPGPVKGDLWFDQGGTTDNLPDNPQ